MKNILKVLVYVTFLVCLLPAGDGKKHRKHSKQPKRSPPPPPPPPPVVPTPGGGASLSVRSYGAKGDGVSDDTNAFAAAWADACTGKGSTVVVPAGFVFLVRQVSFSGRGCSHSLVFQVDGNIIAPTKSGSWKSGLVQWLEFTELRGITIQGKGTIDGRGSVWWGGAAAGKMPSTKPTAVRFYGSTDITVTGVKIQNSPQTHLKFDSCQDVHVYGISVSSPGDSPNTDGIHLQNSQNVLIHTASLSCGDDCISIQTGCSGVYVHNVNCGPGHGISIGGLGKDGTRACVSNVTVRDTAMQGTMTGVRIKTWQGGSGLVQGIIFANIQVAQVVTPIQIDQYYCNSHSCRNKTSAVAVAGVAYQNIQGTYTGASPVRLACSDSHPCAGITMAGINLTPAAGKAADDDEGPFCWKAYGTLQTATVPRIGCLLPEKKPPAAAGGFSSC
ncbi:polygalacturonase At1g48100 [Andrographis paniculata]|uniref:polygalacturonase At1g48100 n=1 Tax=Andrographis paniculata TaxID=175694 RepID=UPI0021E6E865|nr:polygalacturonase At1g48100 [Andrographis paniculata]